MQHVQKLRNRVGCAALFLAVQTLAPASFAQPAAPPSTRPAAQDPVALPPVTVTAEKRTEDLQNVPASVTAVTAQTIADGQIHSMLEASRYTPNLLLSHFSNQRLSFPFIRGIGSGQNSPAVTTYIDGVPQLSFATSNQQLFDIDHIEFLRGPQGSLYGRNTLGGVINIVSRKPTNVWSGNVETTQGNFGLQDYRANVSGPIVNDKAYISVAGGYTTRDGYSKNEITGNDLDDREDYFGRVTLRLTPSDNWEILLSVNGERDRDGDYPLFDLNSLRDHPRRVSHDFKGATQRDIFEPSLVVNYFGQNVNMTWSSSYQDWHSRDTTDLDETPLDAERRDNKEVQRAFVEELRFFSPTDRPVVINNNAKLAWVAGAFFFASTYHQNAVDDIRPGAVGLPAPFGAPFPFQNFQRNDLNDVGAALYGQGTLTLWDKLDLTFGLRYEYQHSKGGLSSFPSSNLIPTASFVKDSRSFYQLSPKVGIGYHWTKDLLTYVSASEGFRAGGFNATPPPGGTGSRSFGQESSWTYEAGVKSSWFNNRLTANADVYYIDWKNVQLDEGNGIPTEFLIANAGKASSVGLELELSARVTEHLDVFGGLGLMNTRFSDNVAAAGITKGNDLPFAPDITWNVGTQYTLPLNGDLLTFARVEVFGVGKYFYEATNSASQGSYILTNFRVGLSNGRWRVEGFIDNAFNTKYEPLAFPFPAPPTFVGESGDPTTFGITLGYSF